MRSSIFNTDPPIRAVSSSRSKLSIKRAKSSSPYVNPSNTPVFASRGVSSTANTPNLQTVASNPTAPNPAPVSNGFKLKKLSWNLDDLITSYLDSGDLPPILSPTLPESDSLDIVPLAGNSQNGTASLKSPKPKYPSKKKIMVDDEDEDDDEDDDADMISHNYNSKIHRIDDANSEDDEIPLSMLSPTLPSIFDSNSTMNSNNNSHGNTPDTTVSLHNITNNNNTYNNNSSNGSKPLARLNPDVSIKWINRAEKERFLLRITFKDKARYKSKMARKTSPLKLAGLGISTSDGSKPKFAKERETPKKESSIKKEDALKLLQLKKTSVTDDEVKSKSETYSIQFKRDLEEKLKRNNEERRRIAEEEEERKARNKKEDEERQIRAKKDSEKEEELRNRERSLKERENRDHEKWEKRRKEIDTKEKELRDKLSKERDLREDLKQREHQIKEREKNLQSKEKELSDKEHKLALAPPPTSNDLSYEQQKKREQLKQLNQDVIMKELSQPLEEIRLPGPNDRKHSNQFSRSQKEEIRDSLQHKKTQWLQISKGAKARADGYANKDKLSSVIIQIDSILARMVSYDYDERSKLVTDILPSERSWKLLDQDIASMIKDIRLWSSGMKEKNLLEFLKILTCILYQTRAIILKRINSILMKVIELYTSKNSPELNSKIIELQQLTINNHHLMVQYFTNSRPNYLDAIVPVRFPTTWFKKSLSMEQTQRDYDISNHHKNLIPEQQTFYLPIGIHSNLGEVSGFLYNIIKEFIDIFNKYNANKPIIYTLQSGQNI